MKRIVYFLVAVVALVAVSSCGVSRKQMEMMLAERDSYNQRMQQQDYANNAQAPASPTRTRRELDPCIVMAMDTTSANMREYGMATSYNEMVAVNAATRAARTRLAQAIKVAVEGAAQDYEKNAQKNNQVATSNLGEQITSQYLSEDVANSRVIQTSMYDFSDGTIQVYVCVEMLKSEKEIIEDVKEGLDRDSVIEIEYDRDRFADKMAEGLDAYKKRRAEENR